MIQAAAWSLPPARPSSLSPLGTLLAWGSGIGMLALGLRGYREAQLDTGIVEGRLHLALGIGASGMTFLDSEVAGLLGEPLAALLITCIGVPAYRNRAGGPPGRPVSVVVPTPRETPTSEVSYSAPFFHRVDLA